MKANLKLTPNIIVPSTHPGKIVEKEILARKLNVNEVRKSLNIAPMLLQQLLAGVAGIDPPLAKKLEELFDIKAETWINFQIAYELDRTKIKYALYMKELTGKEVTVCPLLECPKCKKQKAFKVASTGDFFYLINIIFERKRNYGRNYAVLNVLDTNILEW